MPLEGFGLERFVTISNPFSCCLPLLFSSLVLHLLNNPLGPQEFVVYIWNLHQLSIKAVHPIKHVTTKKPAFWAITNEAKLLYTQQGSKTIHCTSYHEN
jgi:hypothetical protein